MYLNGRRIFNIIEWNKSTKELEITKDGIYDVSDYGYAKVDTGNYISDKFYVMVVDYDGTEIDYVELNNGETYTLPTPPTHANLVFEEWSCTQDIVNNTVTINNNNVMIGPIYNTVSGLSEFDIHLTPGMNKTVTFYGLKSTGWSSYNHMIDWGDGTVETNLSPNSNGYSHTYEDSGYYTIKSDITSFYSSPISKYNITGLYEVRLSNLYTQNYFPPSSVENMSFSKNSSPYAGNAIVIECSGKRLKTLILPANTQYRPGISYIRGCNQLKYIVIPKGYGCGSQFYANSTNAGFAEDYLLKYVVLPVGFTTRLGAYCFNSNKALEQFVIPSGVTTLDNSVFSSIISLKKLVLPNTITTIPSNLCYQCINLIKVIIPDSVTSIGGNAFQGCSKLSDVNLSNNILTIGASAFDSTAIKVLTIPASVTTIYNLGSMPRLEKLIMLNSNTLINYNYGAFQGLPIKEAVISSNISNTYNLFNNCYKLEKVTFLGENIRLPIGQNMFYNCYSLKEINGDIKFTGISSQGASYTSSMKTWNLTGMTSVSNISSGWFYINSHDFKIIVPDSLYESVLANPSWSSYYGSYIYKASEVQEEGTE